VTVAAGMERLAFIPADSTRVVYSGPRASTRDPPSPTWTAPAGRGRGPSRCHHRQPRRRLRRLRPPVVGRPARQCQSGARIRSGRSARRTRRALPRTRLDPRRPGHVPCPGAPRHRRAGVGDRRQLHLHRRAHSSRPGGFGDRPGSPSWRVMARITRRTLGRMITRDELWNGNREQWRNLLTPQPRNQHRALGLDPAQQVPPACYRRRTNSGHRQGPPTVRLTSPAQVRRFRRFLLSRVERRPYRSAHTILS
jgi:hypothetical protein